MWRFVNDAAAHLGVSPVIVADGRPWQVFVDHRFIVLSPSGQVSKKITCEAARSKADARTLGRHAHRWTATASRRRPPGLELMS
ncbi:hypothetical protein ABZS66_28060 [Dactylosporangium sp. NPDC005572]|uniref:hypothetical protein n=1 Tax=Dactylosporangium sp. NPDC005572 TaxID=3156889 RepID=UPI0033ACA310